MPGTVFGQDLSDANLFRRVRRGDTRAFGVLVQRHDATLRKLTSRLLAQPDQADPVLQKAYTKAWRSAAMARLGSGKDAVGIWFYRVVYNTCVDELRRQPQHPAPAAYTGPRVRLPRASVERRISALRALGPAERIPLVLVDSEGFTVQAAARILQRKPAEVAADLAAARRRWRDLVIGPPEPVDPNVQKESGDAEGTSLPDGSSGSPSEPEASPGLDSASSAASPAPEASGNGSKPHASPGSSGTRAGRNPAASDVVHAAEGAFDAERFSRLKRWFKTKGAEDPDDREGSEGEEPEGPEDPSGDTLDAFEASDAGEELVAPAPASGDTMEVLEEQAASADKGTAS